MRLGRTLMAAFCLLLAGCAPPVPGPIDTGEPFHVRAEEPEDYAQSLLTLTQKAAYAEICRAIEAADGAETPTKLKNAVKLSDFTAAWEAVKNDRPAFYWLDCRFFGQKDDMVNSFTVVAAPPFDWADAPERERRMASAADSLLSGLPEGDFERAALLHDRLLSHITYTDGAQADAGTAYAGLVQGGGICGAYARSYQYLLRRLGIPCIYVEGTSVRGIPHAWNMVRLEGEWYCVDLTWDDLPPEKGYLYHDYLFMTTGELMLDHYPDETQYAYLPCARDIRFNFYRARGWYCDYSETALPEEALSRGFMRALLDTNPKGDPGTYFLEIKVFGEYTEFKEWRAAFCGDVFSTLREMKKLAKQENFSGTIVDTGRIEYNFNDNTQVLTLFCVVE